MAWVLEHLQILIGVAAAIAYYLNRGRLQKLAGEQNPRDESEADRGERTRRLQEEIRRKIAERRGEAPAQPASVGRTSAGERIPPLTRPAHVPPLDPFGGPMRKISREIREAAEREFDPQAEQRRREEEAAAHRATLARQEKLEEEMRVLEAARLAEQRRAAEILTARQEQGARLEARRVAGAGLTIGDALRDPRELRRVIVLREVLGAPVALR